MQQRQRNQHWPVILILILVSAGIALEPDTRHHAPKYRDGHTATVDGRQSRRHHEADTNTLSPPRRDGGVSDEERDLVLGKPVDAREQLKREVIGNLARMGFNEAAGARADMIGIWQVTKNIAGRAERADLKGLRAAQRALSPRVNMVLPPRSRHHREYWTRWLRRGKEPIGWPGPQPWDGPGLNDGITQWRTAVMTATSIYNGSPPHRVCRRAVMAWGCNADRYPHCRDPEIAEARGLERDLSCRGTLNWYYYRP